jgi:hypothetical protein
MLKSVTNFLKAYAIVLLVGAFYGQHLCHWDAFPIVQGSVAGSVGAIMGAAFGVSALGSMCGLALELVSERGKIQGSLLSVD